MNRQNIACILTGLAVAALAAGRAPAQTFAPEPGVNPMALEADHVTASVEDLDRESAWYKRVFGMQQVTRSKPTKDLEVLQLGIPGFRIDLVKQAGSSRQHQASGYQAQGWLHVVFRAPSITDAYARLQAQGTDVIANRSDKGEIYRLVLHDPEGNELEVVPLTSPRVLAPARP
jgi:catechol 2,3-dioxygenase-like lactoylglutathione lyase family enzyme